MAKDKIIGRLHETAILEKALHTEEPEFIAVYGRRRIGIYCVINTFRKKIE